jgi:hypothetical protein
MMYQHLQVRTLLRHAHRLRPPWRSSSLPAALLLTVVLGWGTLQLAAALHTRITTEEQVYSVNDLHQQVAHDPRHWLGRTLLVQGRVALDHTWSPPDSIVTRIELVDPGTSGVSLAWGGETPLMQALRRLPLLGRLVPRPQVLRWDTRATYRVQLRAAPAGTCAVPPCYEAFLLDAAP